MWPVGFYMWPEGFYMWPVGFYEAVNPVPRLLWFPE